MVLNTIIDKLSAYIAYDSKIFVENSIKNFMIKRASCLKLPRTAWSKD